MSAKQQPEYIRTLAERAQLLVDEPDRFPSLYSGLWRRVPSRKVRQQYAAIMAEHGRMMDVESRRCGSPRADGSTFGLSEKVLALRIGIGDPRHTNPQNKHWRGRRVLQHRIAELRAADLLEWGRPEWRAAGRACNPRARIEKGPRAGTFALYPSVRQISMKYLQAVSLDRRLPIEVEDLRRRRADGKVRPIVDVFRRRARDRQIKAAWRTRLAAERGQVVRANPIAALWSPRRQE